MMRKEIFQDVFTKRDKETQKEQPSESIENKKGLSSRSVKGTLAEYHPQNKNASLLKLLNQIKATSNIVPPNIQSLNHLAPRDRSNAEGFPLTVSMKVPSKTYASIRSTAIKSQDSLTYSDIASQRLNTESVDRSIKEFTVAQDYGSDRHPYYNQFNYRTLGQLATDSPCQAVSQQSTGKRVESISNADSAAVTS